MAVIFCVFQWQALTLLVLGICVNQFLCPHSSLSSGENAPLAHWLAYFYILACVAVPAAASVLSEYAIKRYYETSIHVQVRERE